MAVSLKDIMDLDYLIRLDDTRAGEDQNRVRARDRDIFNQIDTHGLDDRGLIFAWLEFRKLLFFHETKNPDPARLPGSLFLSLYQWTCRGLALAGMVLGLVTAYSFLAYHGSRPVNVTLFIAFFIIFQGLLSLASAGVMIRRIQGETSGNTRSGPFFIHALIFEFFKKQFKRLAKGIGPMPGKENIRSISEAKGFFKLNTREYQGILFWPFFSLSSLAALFFSLGALCGTLFRVLVTDLAFGWQSTLLQSGSQIHSLVSFLALPWSWILPESMGVPTLEQIEGSRILLKEGILGLATEHLVAWWPFLCLGILFYGVILRLGLLGGAVLARKRAVDRFDFSLPRYKRLVARMRSPQMDIKVRHIRGSIAPNRAPLPDPFLENPCNEGWVEEKKEKVPVNGYQKISGLVIGSARVYPESAMASACQALEAQLGVNVTQSCSLSLDLEKDLSLLEPLVPSHGKAPVIMLQEVWQPPIRGVLHYIVQIRQSLFPDRPFWIFLTQTPGADSPGVDNEDINYQVWKTAVAQMNDPDIILERWMS